MIQRQVRKTEIGPGRVRYRVLVTGEECPAGTNESRVNQSLLLHWIADSQSLLCCGYEIPQKVLITHNGRCWQAEAEADVDEEVG